MSECNEFGEGADHIDEPSGDGNYNDLLIRCYGELMAKNSILENEYGFGTYERWDINQEDGLLIFSNQGVPKLTCSVVFLGSFSEVTETWLWGWANATIKDELSEPALKIREYGIQHDIPEFCYPKIAVTEQEAWGIGAIGCRILDGMGIYRGPAGNGFILMLITSIAKS